MNLEKNHLHQNPVKIILIPEVFMHPVQFVQTAHFYTLCSTKASVIYIPYSRMDGLKTISCIVAQTQILNFWEYPRGRPCVKCNYLKVQLKREK